jgi:uncharacterized protein YgiM (DUF1202 family)
LTIIGYLKRGQMFKVKGFLNNPGKSDDWYKCRYKGKKGYVFSRYVKVVWR